MNHPKLCPKCGTTWQGITPRCGLCKRPIDAPASFDLPEHDHPDYPAARARILPSLGLRP